jgi:hypothetical protein
MRPAPSRRCRRIAQNATAASTTTASAIATTVPTVRSIAAYRGACRVAEEAVPDVPDDPAEDVVDQEGAVGHPGGAGDRGHQRPQDGDEPAEQHGQPATPAQHHLGPVHPGRHRPHPPGRDQAAAQVPAYLVTGQRSRHGGDDNHGDQQRKRDLPPAGSRPESPALAWRGPALACPGNPALASPGNPVPSGAMLATGPVRFAPPRPRPGGTPFRQATRPAIIC